MKNKAFRLLTVIVILFYSLLFSGLLGLTGLHGLGKDGGVHIFHHLAAGFFVAYLVVGLASQLYKGGKYVAGYQQVLAAMLGLIIMGFIVGDPDNYGNNVAIFDLALLIFIIPIIILYFIHPNRREILKFKPKNVSKPVIGIYLVLIIPLFYFGIQQAILQRNSFPPLSDIHHSHWHAMADWAFATVLLGFVAAFKSRGYLLPLILSAVSVVFVGLVSVFSTQPSSLGAALGLTAFVLGISLLIYSYNQKTLKSK